jgi:hypothetical protein
MPRVSKVVGDHLLCEADVLVFQHVYQGVTYAVAARVDDATLVDYRQLTGANATTVILAAFADLTAGRTWKEKVVIMGNYVDLGQLALPNYIVVEIIGYLKARNALNTHFITNDNPAGGNVDITIIGGHVDANKENQAADMSCIHLENVARPEVCFVKVRGGKRVTASHGEGICFWGCTSGKIIGNHCYEAYYDNIKVRGASTDCVVVGNTTRDSEAGAGIQISSAGTERNVIANNTLRESVTTLTNALKIHYADNNIIIGNVIYAINPVSILDDAHFNHFVENYIYQITDAAAVCCINLQTVGAGKPSYNDFHSNYFFNIRKDGVDVTNGTGNVFEDNYLQFSTGGAIRYGFYLTGGSTNSRVTKNTIVGVPANQGVVDAGVNSMIKDNDEEPLTRGRYQEAAAFPAAPNGAWQDGDVVVIKKTAAPTGYLAYFYDGINWYTPRTPLMAKSITDLKTDGTDEFLPVMGASSPSSEAYRYELAPMAGVIKNMTVMLTAAPGGAASRTFTLRVNGVSTALTVTISAGATTGEDTVHSVEVSRNDRLAWFSDGGVGAPAAAAVAISADFIPYMG